MPKNYIRDLTERLDKKELEMRGRRLHLRKRKKGRASFRWSES
jgi:hypothetical protein